jgi:hypothetical protein
MSQPTNKISASLKLCVFASLRETKLRLCEKLNCILASDKIFATLTLCDFASLRETKLHLREKLNQ